MTLTRSVFQQSNSRMIRLVGSTKSTRSSSWLYVRWYHCLRGCTISHRHQQQWQSQHDVLTTRYLHVWEIPATNVKNRKDNNADDRKCGGVLYTFKESDDADDDDKNNRRNKVWSIHDTSRTGTTLRDVHGNNSMSSQHNKNNAGLHSLLSQSTVSLLLPAQYPKSVAPGYLGFASFCFSASIAGSAAMVLSTQTLLLAVGIVGQNVQQASIMAGAFNWVMKDFVGQLGGVLFASQMGRTRAFDSDPKRWRMVAAIALDSATLLEILSPLFHSSLVLPVASVANIGKNIGFLTASASRAALHQSLAISGNLGDVTAKSGSQTIMASLIGTSLGIGLSSLLQHDTFNFAMGFFCLSMIHQGCNYLSLQHVPLAHFNRQRLRLVIERYLQDGKVSSPAEVAQAERFFPFLSSDSTKDWLNVGRPLNEFCPDPSEIEKLLVLLPEEEYLIRFSVDSQKIDVVYFSDATGEDVIRGMYHACLLRQLATANVTTASCADGQNLHQYQKESSDEKIQRTHLQVRQQFSCLLKQLHEQGWNTTSDVTTAESNSSKRIMIDNELKQL